MNELQRKQDLGRAKNVVQEFLRNKLLIPKIYLDADWNGTHVDVLAVDRAGVGDVHAVRCISVDDNDAADWKELVIYAAIRANLEREPLMGLPLLDLPMQFRYVALVSFFPGIDRFEVTQELARKMLNEDGVGRIGILTVDMSVEDPIVRTVLKPERFRSSKEIVELADRYVAEHTPNWEVRE